MKKLLGISMMALVLAAVSAPRASAWANFNFGVGLNLSFQSANNCWLWGAIRNGPTGMEGSNWAYGPAPGLGGMCATPYYNAGYAYPYGAAVTAPAPAVTTAPAPTWVAPAPTPGAKKDNAPAGTQRSSYFQPVAYPGANTYAPTGYSAYPQSPAYFQAPSYWYGR
jgi:hypothetical protein